MSLLLQPVVLARCQSQSQGHSFHCARQKQLAITLHCRCNSQISIPDPFVSMVKQLNFLTLDVLVLVNLNCLHDYDWRTGFLLRCCMPAVLVVLIKAVAAWRARAVFGARSHTHTRARARAVVVIRARAGPPPRPGTP